MTATVNRAPSDRLYRALLQLFPRRFRHEFGSDMAQLFRDQRLEARRERGVRGVLRVWRVALADLVAQSMSERSGGGRSVGPEPPPERLRNLLRDGLFAVRVLGRSPAFALVAVISLALGVGANSAIFSLVNAVFLRPLPYEQSEQLVKLKLGIHPAEGEFETLGSWSYPYYAEFARQELPLGQVAVYANTSLTLTGLDSAERVIAEWVSGEYLPLLRVAPQTGRIFGVEEADGIGEAPVALLSDGAWKRIFGADPDIVGREVTLDRQPFEIIGVMPPGFAGLTRRADVFLPMGMAPIVLYPEALTEQHGYWKQVVGRLRDGYDTMSAAADLGAAGAAMLEALPADGYARLEPFATPLRDEYVDPQIRRPLALLLGAVGFVLLIACVNVANLMLSRGLVRRREIATRMAVGAGRGRVLSQLLTEGLVLGVGGGLLGLALANWALVGLRRAMPPSDNWAGYADAVEAIAVDLRVLAFTFGVALVAAVVTALVPAWQVARVNLRDALGGTPAGGVSQGRLRMLGGRSLLIVMQLALAVVLLVGAGLMLRTLSGLMNATTGFDPQGVAIAHFQIDRDKYPAAVEFYRPLLENLNGLAAVESATVTTSIPLDGTGIGTIAALEGSADSPGDFSAGHGVGVHVVGPDYLETIGARLLRGRTITISDDAGAPLVAMVNRTAADRLWPGDDALGKRLGVGIGIASDDWIEVVGVVDDVRYDGVVRPVAADIYLSYAQSNRRSYHILVKTAEDPDALIMAIRDVGTRIDPEAPLFAARLLSSVARDSLAHTRFLALLLAAFAAVALSLAASGVYGVMAYLVAGRTHEIGVRKALGASRTAIRRMVLRDGLLMAAAGGALGLVAAQVLSRSIESQLYGVGSADPLALGVTTVALVAVAVLASWIPARRAAATDPVRSLRSE